MLWTMPRRPANPVPDVFEAFPHRVDSGDAEWFRSTPRSAPRPFRRHHGGAHGADQRGLRRRAWLAGRVRPELVFANLLWESVAITVWSIAWGALCAMAVLAAGVVAVGLPWVRRQREARATSTSTP